MSSCESVLNELPVDLPVSVYVTKVSFSISAKIWLSDEVTSSVGGAIPEVTDE